MKNYFIDRNDAFVMLIDVQEKLIAAMKDKIEEDLKKNCEIILQTAKEYNIPVIVTEQYRRGLGNTVHELQDVIQGSDNLEKTFFNCTKDCNIDTKIDSMDKKTAILMGIESHICVLQTALSLLQKGMNVIIASDAVASRRKKDWEMALRVLEDAGAIIYPTETISFMILEKAGTPEFKKISPLFK